MKKVKWLSIKNVLFTYLAINKILYWFNTITALDQTDFGTAANVILSRFLNNDLLLILSIIAFFYLDEKIEQKKAKHRKKKKAKHRKILEYVKFYAIGYVMIMGIILVYNVLMISIFQTENFYLAEFMLAFLNFIPNLTAGYLVVAVALEIKQYFKAKEKEAHEDISPDKVEHYKHFL